MRMRENDPIDGLAERLYVSRNFAGIRARTGFRGWPPCGPTPRHPWSGARHRSGLARGFWQRQPTGASRRMGVARPQRAGEIENGTERLATSAENVSYLAAFLFSPVQTSRKDG